MNTLLARKWFWVVALLGACCAGALLGWATADRSAEVAATGESADNPSSDETETAAPGSQVAAPGLGSASADPGAPCDGRIDGPVELTLTAHSSSDAYVSAVQSFNSGPGAELGITVELLDLGEQAYEEFIANAIESEDFPDIVDMDGPFLYDFAWNDYVQPLGNCVDEQALSDFLPSIISQGTYEGELYSLGSFDSGLGLWAKRSVLESAGARIPTSAADAWSETEFDRILRDLQAAGIDAPLDIKWWYGAGEWYPFGFAPIIQSAGGDLIDRSDFRSAQGALNSSGAVGAMTRFQRWAQDGLIDLQATDDTNFTEGDAAISWVGHWMYNPYLEALGDDLVLLPLPDFGNGSVTGMGSWNWAMSSTAADPDAVWAFIEHVTAPEQVEVIAAAEGAVPSRISVLDADPSFSPGGDRYLYRANLEQAPEVARPRPATPAYRTIRNAFSDAFVNIVSGADVQDSLDDAVIVIDNEISANGDYPGGSSD